MNIDQFPNLSEFAASADAIIAAHRELHDRSTENAIVEIQTSLAALMAPAKVKLKGLWADAGASHEPEIKRTLARRNAFTIHEQLEILGEIDRDLSRKKNPARERAAVEVARLDAVSINAATDELLARVTPELKGAIATFEHAHTELRNQHGRVQANRRAGGGALWRGGPDEHALSNAIRAIERLKSLVK